MTNLRPDCTVGAVRTPGSTGRSRRPAGFGAIWSVVAVDQIGFGILIALLPLYAVDFGASPTTIGLLLASFSLTQLMSAAVGGRLSDRFGRRPVLLLCLLGTAVGSFITAAAGSIAILFVGRLVDGLSGASGSVAQAAVSDIAEERDRPRLLGLIGASFGLGFVIGPLLGSLASLIDARAPFVLAGTIALVNLGVAWFRLPETGGGGGGQGGSTRLFVKPGPIAGRLMVVTLVGSVAFAGFTGTLALLGELRVGMDQGSVGLVFAGIGVAMILVQTQVVQPVNAAWGPSTTTRVALGCNVIGLVLLSQAEGWGLLVPALGFLVLGQAVITPTVASAVVGVVPLADRGATLGLNQSAAGLGRVLGPLLAGALFDLNPRSPYLLGAAMALLALVLVPTVARRPDPG